MARMIVHGQQLQRFLQDVDQGLADLGDAEAVKAAQDAVAATDAVDPVQPDEIVDVEQDGGGQTRHCEHVVAERALLGGYAHDQAQIGQIMSRATQDVEAMRMYVSMGLIRVGAILILMLAVWTRVSVVVVALFFATPHRWRWAVLLGASAILLGGWGMLRWLDARMHSAHSRAAFAGLARLRGAWSALD